MSPGKHIRIVLADDHELVRNGFGALLDSMPDVQVIGDARNGEELLALLERVQPDLVLTDISMPVLDGVAATQAIRQRFPDVRVMVLSMYDTVDFVKRAVDSGACGYIMKDASPAELELAVHQVMDAGGYFSPAVARLMLQRGSDSAKDQLTERQLEILTLIAEGLSAKEIGYELGLSPKTVDVHRARIMERLHLKDVASLTRYAIRQGLVSA